MNRPYGPWATLITAGQNPQLSTFWRRRMEMLAVVNRASSASVSTKHRLADCRGLVRLSPADVCAPVAAQEEKSISAKSQDQKSDERVTRTSPAPSSHAPAATRRRNSLPRRLPHLNGACSFPATHFCNHPPTARRSASAASKKETAGNLRGYEAAQGKLLHEGDDATAAKRADVKKRR